MSNSVDTMKNFVNVLKLYANDTTTDGVAILDHAVRTTTRFAGLHDAVNNFIADMANVSATAARRKVSCKTAALSSARRKISRRTRGRSQRLQRGHGCRQECANTRPRTRRATFANAVAR